MTLYVTCPTCHSKTPWEGNPWRPFCSERCKLIDLGDWAGENHRIPGAPHLPMDDNDEDSDST
ncbi:MAG: DNA gyrase inhibitor YacG [Gammaproteobacteria bacterium]|nr:DNA gyrase inhibitor YacG [Gammaproteobacteria bacterium]MCW8840096.1 DNA gyrase inhibitor YacG [Gammaproteobacteria bacterium]MCW8928237.1 DNA gyrase inhibitor YacG [Gammaproteobacteria bacterium]MCW8958498.1 DNA gyrase inhibitor YacG [Gammaproteobacteria bacterium]MCW8973883.1 DNA gyrase inhibitor YacG [Gammaproteobacteria bacterium]